MSTILLGIVLGDRPDDFADVLPGFKLKWPQKHAKQREADHFIVQESPQMQFTLEGIQHQADFRFLNLDKLNICPVPLKRFRFTPGEPPPIKRRSLLVKRTLKRTDLISTMTLYPPLETGNNHRLQHVAEARFRLEKERDFRTSMFKKYRRGANVADGIDTALSMDSVGWAASVVGGLGAVGIYWPETSSAT